MIKGQRAWHCAMRKPNAWWDKGEEAKSCLGGAGLDVEEYSRIFQKGKESQVDRSRMFGVTKEAKVQPV